MKMICIRKGNGPWRPVDPNKPSASGPEKDEIVTYRYTTQSGYLVLREYSTGAFNPNWFRPLDQMELALYRIEEEGAHPHEVLELA